MKGSREFRDPRCQSSDLEPEFSFLPFLSTPGGTQGSLVAMVMQLLPLATMHCAGTQTGKRRSQLGKAPYWTTGANGAYLLPSPGHSHSKWDSVVQSPPTSQQSWARIHLVPPTLQNSKILPFLGGPHSLEHSLLLTLQILACLVQICAVQRTVLPG